MTRDITSEFIRSIMSYDPETGLMWWKPRAGTSGHDRRWNGRNAGKQVGSHNSAGYMQTHIFGNCYLIHRLVWLHVYGSFPSGDIDHIDRVKDNNRISNLRIATLRENNINQKLRVTNTSGFKGVSWNAQKRKWQVFIKIDGRNKNLGAFVDKDEAAETYRRAAEALHGQFMGQMF